MLNAYIYDGLRSAFGKHGGSLAKVRPDDLAALVIKALIEKNNLPKDSIDDVIFGNSNQAGEDSRNIARHAVLLAGLDVKTPAQTVNRLCASGLAAVIDSARAITCGEGDIYIAGGVESMSRAPFVMGKSEQAFSRDIKVFDTTIGARFSNPQIEYSFGDDTMPKTGDNVAHEFRITRQQADEFALASQHKYQKAKEAGFFDEEITPIQINQGKKLPLVDVVEDEHPRLNSQIESLTKLKPLFEGGIVTAGNASGINDGAVALIIGSKDAEKIIGRKPIAKILASAAMGIEPRIMGAGPIEAIKLALKRAELSLDEVDIIEINEAFASQVLSCLKGLNVDFNDSRVNPNGGAIALGHPLGASGARLTLTVARELQRSKKKYAVISLCIGVGQGLAMVIERM
ncbi:MULTISPECIES: 3-oxoadipyl-CoA thiolase [unclassified Acinetobacter]|uniref:3-oxoadipyl-CoA thiolase n=1 Tax=unclassified Acinetobacter TaxID=196816 RepID=UPI0015D14057|nr:MULTISPECIES: 3-oxoadipyl-CoA thiolase [unclassified Acinetobacter]